jgi:hypothetical protein
MSLFKNSFQYNAIQQHVIEFVIVIVMIYIFI